jgi:Tfp pilus assembly protein PilF
MNRTGFAATLSLALLLSGSPLFADMNKTAPAIKAHAGSKAEQHINEGIEHYDKGHWDVAKKHFQEAVKTDPTSAEAHYDLALSLDKAGEHKAAIEHFKKALELGKDNPEIQQSEILHAHLKKH